MGTRHRGRQSDGVLRGERRPRPPRSPAPEALAAGGAVLRGARLALGTDGFLSRHSVVSPSFLEELGGVSACVWCQNSSWLLLPLSPQRAPRSAGRCPSVPAQGGRRGREASTARSGSRPRSQPRVSRAHVPTNAPHTHTHTHMYVRTQTWSLAQSLQASQSLRGHHVPSAQPAACPTPCPGCWWPHTYATRPEACARPALEWLPLRMK